MAAEYVRQKLAFHVTGTLHRQLKYMAAKRGLTMTCLIEELIAKEAEREKLRNPVDWAGEWAGA